MLRYKKNISKVHETFVHLHTHPKIDNEIELKIHQRIHLYCEITSDNWIISLLKQHFRQWYGELVCYSILIISIGSHTGYTITWKQNVCIQLKETVHLADRTSLFNVLYMQVMQTLHQMGGRAKLVVSYVVYKCRR